MRNERFNLPVQRRRFSIRITKIKAFQNGLPFCLAVTANYKYWINYLKKVLTLSLTIVIICRKNWITVEKISPILIFALNKNKIQVLFTSL